MCDDVRWDASTKKLGNALIASKVIVLSFVIFGLWKVTYEARFGEVITIDSWYSKI